MKEIRRITPNEIKSLKSNEVFVFGSNVQGEHVGGAAKFAYDKFGAIMGEGVGFQGQSYAIPTCVRFSALNGNRFTMPFKSANEIKPYVNSLECDVKYFTNKRFYVTKIGCGIAGFSIEDIARLFEPLKKYKNVYLPIEFWEEYDKDA